MPRRLVMLVMVAATAAGLSGCGGEDSSGPSSSGTSSSSGVSPSASASASASASSPSAAGSSSPASPSQAAGTSIDITIKNGKVTPNGERVKVSVGKPVTLRIDADTSGEIHVHSTPEQEIEFPEGSSTKQLTISKPGIVDVEDHALDQVIVQLQAS